MQLPPYIRLELQHHTWGSLPGMTYRLIAWHSEQDGKSDSIDFAINPNASIENQRQAIGVALRRFANCMEESYEIRRLRDKVTNLEKELASQREKAARVREAVLSPLNK